MSEGEAEELRKRLEALVDTVLITGYNHADWEWTHSRAWHAERYALVVNEVLDVLNKNPDYRWYFDTKNEELQPFIDRYPSRMGELRERVRQGKIGIAGGTITNPQTPNVGGELFIRNMKYGRRYFEREFPGVNLSALVLNDVMVGYSQLPQIVRKGGYTCFRFTRPVEALDAKGVPRDFFWEGLDGTKILCSRGNYGLWTLIDARRFPADYRENWGKAFATVASDLSAEAGLVKSGVLWAHEGMDDKRPLRGPRPAVPGVYPPGGSKLEEILDEPTDLVGFIQEWNERERIRMRFATPTEYFDELLKRKDRLPVWRGVLDPMAWVMMHACKGYCPGNASIEATLLAAEKMCSIAWLLGQECPQGVFDDMWRELLSISAHAMRYSYAEDYYKLKLRADTLKASAQELASAKMAWIARRVRPARDSEARIVVFNELSWDRKDVVKASIAIPLAGTWRLKLTDGQGKEVSHQVVRWVPYSDGSLSEGEIIFIADVPGLGYSTYYLSRAEAGPEPAKHLETADALNTRMFNMRLEDGGVKSLYDKRLGREVLLGREALGNDLLLYRAEPMRDFRPGVLNGVVDRVKCSDVRLVEDGPVRKRVVVEGTIGQDIEVVREISLYDDIPRVDFLTRIHAREGDGTFRAEFPLAFGGKLTAAIPFGAEDRDLSAEPRAGYERDYRGYENCFYAMGWLDLTSSDGSCGAAIMPSVKDLALQGFSSDPSRNVVEITLLTIMTLPTTGWLSETSPEIEGHGLEEFAYSLYPHRGDWREGEVHRRALEFQKPLRAVVTTGESLEPQMPDRRCFLRVSPANVVLASLYCEANKLVMRLYEQYGLACEADIVLPIIVGRVEVTDFNGNPLKGQKGSIRASANGISLQVSPWDIRTLVVETAGETAPAASATALLLLS